MAGSGQGPTTLATEFQFLLSPFSRPSSRTLLIIRDMLTGARHFNDLERSLPGISRALLAHRLRQLEHAGIVEKRYDQGDRRSTEYDLTAAGLALHEVIQSLLMWGTAWAFGDPTLDQLDPLLLLWWMRNRVNVHQLPDGRVVVQFDFYGPKTDTYWLVLSPDDVTICLTHPGYEVQVWVVVDLATFFKVWLGQLDYHEAISTGNLTVTGIPHLVRGFPTWFAWSPAAPAVRAARTNKGVLRDRQDGAAVEHGR